MRLHPVADENLLEGTWNMVITHESAQRIIYIFSNSFSKHFINPSEEFADQNAESAQITIEHMNELDSTVDKCNAATDRVVGVSDKLIGYVHETEDRKKILPIK